MQKIKINGFLKTKSFEEEEYFDFSCEGFKDENRLIYKENDTDVVITLKEDELEMSRDKKDLFINFVFCLDKNTKGTYHLKEIEKDALLEIYTDELQIIDNFLSLKYYLSLENENMGIFEFILKWEMI